MSDSSHMLMRLVSNLAHQEGGHLTVSHQPDDTAPWLVGSTFGREDEDSPMAGGAVYGAGDTLEEALDQAVSDL